MKENLISLANNEIFVWWFWNDADYACRCGSTVKQNNIEKHLKTCFAYGNAERKFSKIICGKCKRSFQNLEDCINHWQGCQWHDADTREFLAETNRVRRQRELLRANNDAGPFAGTSQDSQLSAVLNAQVDRGRAIFHYLGNENGYACACGQNTIAKSLDRLKSHLSKCDKYKHICHKDIGILCNTCKTECFTVTEASAHFPGCTVDSGVTALNPKDDGRIKCQFCTMSFMKTHGLSMHCAQRHAGRNKNPEYVKPRWNDSEINMLVDAEASLRLSTKDTLVGSESSKRLGPEVANAIFHKHKKFKRSHEATRAKVNELAQRDTHLEKVLTRLNNLIAKMNGSVSPEDYYSRTGEPDDDELECEKCKEKLMEAIITHIASVTCDARREFLEGVLDDLDSFNAQSLLACNKIQKDKRTKRPTKRKLKERNSRSSGVRYAIRDREVGTERAIFETRGPKKCLQHLRDKSDSGKCPKAAVDAFKEIFENCEDDGDNHPYHHKNARFESHRIHRVICKDDIDLNLSEICCTTAPGPDGLLEEDLRRILADDFACLFNIFLLHEDVPLALKVNRTTMIPKANPPGVGDWRPITVASLVDRLFAKVLEKRLSLAVDINKNQRGFLRKVDGCAENITAYGGARRLARKKGKEIVVVSVDLAKAFDSVRYSTIRRALVRLGLDRASVKLFSNLCLGQTTKIAYDGGVGKVELNKGVRQGWPLSPVLFLCVVDELLCELSPHDGFRVAHETPTEDPKEVTTEGILSSVSFADDLTLYSNSPEGMQNHLYTVQDWCKDRIIKINPNKSTVLYLKPVPGQKRVVVKPLDLEIDDIKVPIVMDSFERVLGVHMNCKGEVDFREGKFFSDLTLVLSSKLRPTQKLAMIRDSLILSIKFRLVYGLASKTKCKEVDKTIRQVVKKALHLCEQFPNGALYTKRSLGGLGIPRLKDIVPLEQAGLILRMVISRNLVTRTLVDQGILAKLLSKYGKSCGVDIIDEDSLLKIRSYLSEKRTKDFAKTTYGQGWTTYKNAPRMFLDRPWDTKVNWSERNVIRVLRMRANYSATMVLSQRFNRSGSSLCRGCAKAEETLGHILSACLTTKPNRIQRHNSVCDYLCSILCGVYPADKVHNNNTKYVVGPGESNKRFKEGKIFQPDIVVDSHGAIVIIEVTIVFEKQMEINTSEDSLVTARTRKRGKYSFLANMLAKRSGEKVFLNTMVVGARGGWIKSNSEVFNGTFEVQFTNMHKEHIVERAVLGSIVTHSRFIQEHYKSFNVVANTPI